MNAPESNLPLTGTKEELAEAWAARLKDEFWTAQALEQAAAVFIDTAGEKVPASPPPGALGLLVGRYAIRRDDVKVFETVIAALGAAASAGFFLGDEPLPKALASVATAILTFIWELRSSGATLDDDEVRVMTILRANVRRPTDPGMTPKEILQVVRRVWPEKDLTWVKSQLADLAKMPVQSGVIKELVSVGPRGRWRPQV